MPTCAWCLKTATKQCACCATATYCSVECQKADYSVHKLEAIGADIVSPTGLSGKETNGEEDPYEPSLRRTTNPPVVSRRRTTAVPKPSVAQNSILPRFLAEIDKLMAVRKRRTELMNDDNARAQFVEKNKTRETLLMAQTRELTDRQPHLKAQLESLFRIEADDTAERIKNHAEGERGRIEEYARKNGIVLDWTLYSNIVRLRMLSAYQLAVGVGEDQWGETDFCEAGMENAEQAKRLLTEFLLRPTMNRYGATLYAEYEVAAANKTRATDVVAQYVDDFFPFYWARVEDDLVAMVVETFAPRNPRIPINKRSAEDSGDFDDRRRKRHLSSLGVKNNGDEDEGGDGVNIEGAFQSLVERLVEDSPQSQNLINDINRVRKSKLNERIRELSEGYGDAVDTNLMLEGVMADARLVMDTMRNTASVNAGLHGIDRESQDAMLRGFQEKHLEKMEEAVSSEQSSLWGKIRRAGSWVLGVTKTIVPVVIAIGLIVGSVHYLAKTQAHFSTTVTPEASLTAIEQQQRAIIDEASATTVKTRALYNDVARQQDENLRIVDTRSRVMTGPSIEMLATQQFYAETYIPTNLQKMKETYIEASQRLLGYKVPSKGLLLFNQEAVDAIDRVLALSSDATVSTSEKFSAVEGLASLLAQADEQAKNSQAYQALLLTDAAKTRLIDAQYQEIDMLYRNLENNIRVMESAKRVLPEITASLDSIKSSAEASLGHVQEARRVQRNYGEQRPLMRALLRWLGKDYEKYMHPCFALQDLQSLGAVDMALFTAVATFSGIEIALGGLNNIMALSEGRAMLYGMGAFYGWTRDWGNLGAIRTVLTAVSLVTNVAKLSALVPLKKTLEELVFVFEYDFSEPIPLEDTFFLQAIMRERPDLSPERQQLYVRAREDVLLGRAYSADLYQAQFVANDAVAALDDDELEFLQRIREEVNRDLRVRNVRAIYRYFFGDWCPNAASVIMGFSLKTVDFAAGIVDKSIAYIGTTQRLAQAGQILNNAVCVVQLFSQISNIVRYAVICCSAVVQSSVGQTAITVGIATPIVYNMYRVVSRIYHEATAVPRFDQSDSYYAQVALYTKIVLTEAWHVNAPVRAVLVWNYTPYVVFTLNTVLSLQCLIRGEAYPDTFNDVVDYTDATLWEMDPLRLFAPTEFFRGYMDQSNGAAGAASAGSDYAEVASKSATFIKAEQAVIEQVTLTANLTQLVSRLHTTGNATAVPSANASEWARLMTI